MNGKNTEVWIILIDESPKIPLYLLQHYEWKKLVEEIMTNNIYRYVNITRTKKNAEEKNKCSKEAQIENLIFLFFSLSKQMGFSYYYFKSGV